MSKEKIIVALDVTTAKEARRIIEELRSEVGAFKIGLQLFTSEGASFVREAVEKNIEIFLDVKFHDIPNTVAKASIEAARLGVWMFNIHASGGAEMMRRAVGEVSEVCARENLRRPKIIGVTVLTSFDRNALREVGIEAEMEKQVLNLAALSAQCGLDGVVASPLEIRAIRGGIERKDFTIITPGIRSRESRVESRETKNEQQIAETSDDQKRVMSAKEAIAAGADYLVIGRPITQANDKILAVRKIVEEI
ncbi:MAG: orotidine-5'-phosphate decarboxylase [Pyrinomonadaceae bacterium]